MVLQSVYFNITLSAGAFTLINSASGWAQPLAVKAKDSPKWKNTIASFVHAIISGLVAPYIILTDPEVIESPIEYNSEAARAMIAVTIGYFIYDISDMMRTAWDDSTTKEVIHHHIFCVIAMSLILVSQSLTGVAILGLAVEFNTIFLHLRKLIRMSGFSSTSSIYKLVAWINIVTHVALRLGGWGLLVIYVLLNGLFQNTVGVASLVGVPMIWVINWRNFKRILKNDFGGRVKNAENEEEK